VSSVIHICDGTSVPGETECREAIWSQGRACKGCYREDCYRQGWRKAAVDQDNVRLVVLKREGLPFTLPSDEKILANRAKKPGRRAR
jgi:hypothetical protein